MSKWVHLQSQEELQTISTCEHKANCVHLKESTQAGISKLQPAVQPPSQTSNIQLAVFSTYITTENWETGLDMGPANTSARKMIFIPLLHACSFFSVS